MANRQSQWTIGALGKRFGLSRSTLLYYDSIGLLKPSGRMQNNYRVYSDDDAGRLEQICQYRKTGLSLVEINRVMDQPRSSLAKVLEQRLKELNQEIERLGLQQRFILEILQKGGIDKSGRRLSKQTWVGILSAAGFSQEDMMRWHAEFERQAPDRHQAFLEFLHIPPEEIKQIRAYAKKMRAK